MNLISVSCPPGPYIRKALAMATVLLTSMANAGFFIPKDTTMVMTTLSPDEQNYEVAHGFTRSVSGSVGLTRVQEGSSSAPWRNIAMAQANYLLYRAGDDKGIFNAYVWAGPLAERLEAASGTRVGGQTGLWLDYETRRIYTRVKLHAFKSERWRRNEVVAQAMVAPYAADYEDIASWGGVQVKRVSGDKTEITPYVRFFQRRWWVDAGVSVDRAHRNNFFFNLMVTF
ncbi:MAG: hypothetical protein ACRCWJ_05055 [Casimicrobium sp.]